MPTMNLVRAAAAGTCVFTMLQTPAMGQGRGDTSAAARANRVERSILPSARVRGRAYAPATIGARMAYYHVPAVSVAVLHNGAIAWARAYGIADLATGRPATPMTLFQAASISKPVASVAALQLVEEGKLSLDAPVNTELRSWKLPDNQLTAGHPVTLRELMTHTAGLTVHGFPGYAAGVPVPTIAQVLDGAAPANTPAVRVETMPGTRWNYSGGGITIMQLLLTDVTGTPFPRLMRQRVLGPAGMRASTYEQPLPAARAREAATGYRPNGSAIEGRYHTYPEMAAAGLWTNPTDLGYFMGAVQRAYAGRPHAILTPSVAAQMLTPGLGSWGLGVEIRGAGDSLVFTHGGANEGFRAIFAGYVHAPDGVAVMTNSDAGSAVADEIVRAVAHEYGWPGFGPLEIVPVSVSAEMIRSWAGSYGDPEHPIQVVVDAGVPYLIEGGRRTEMVPTGPDAFALAEGGLRATFVRGPDQRVTGLSANGTAVRRLP